VSPGPFLAVISLLDTCAAFWAQAFIINVFDDNIDPLFFKLQINARYLPPGLRDSQQGSVVFFDFH